MSIEQQLKEAFKQDDNLIKRPPALDTRIAAEFRRQMMVSKGELNMRKRWTASKLVFIALIAVMILSGFAYAGTKLLFTDEKGRFSITARSSEHLNLDAETLQSVRQSLKEIKAQLAPGESAVVYMSEFDFQGGWLSAYQPVAVTGLDQWKSQLQERNMDGNLPASLPGSFQFAEGIWGNPFSAFLGLDDLELWNELRAESKQTGNTLLWSKSSQTQNWTSTDFTTVYRNADEDTIYLTLDVLNEAAVKAEQLAPSNNEYEELQWDGLKVHYTKTTQWMYSDSNFYQDLMWIQENDGKTTIFHLGSDSLNLTKEQLIEIAKSLS